MPTHHMHSWSAIAPPSSLMSSQRPTKRAIVSAASAPRPDLRVRRWGRPAASNRAPPAEGGAITEKSYRQLLD
jgi:hypothetical protein